MSDTDRVQRWRKRQREDGKEPMTIWLSHDEKLRLEDLAQTWHCSPSTLVQQALAQYHPGSPAVSGTLADTAQVRTLVADIVAAMLTRDLPARVRHVLQDLQPSLPQSPAVTATNGNVTDTVPTETDAPTAAPTRPTAQRKRRDQPQASPDPLDAQICAFLRTHSEGGSVKELVAALDAPESKIRLRVNALAKCGHIQMRGPGKSLRYVLTAPE